MAAESSSSTSRDSLGSLTAGDVLVRSTGAHGLKGSGGSGCGNGVALCVTKLREAFPSRQTSGVALGRGETPCVSPAVSSNRASSCRVVDVTPCSAAPGIYLLYLIYFSFAGQIQVRFNLLYSVTERCNFGSPVCALILSTSTFLQCFSNGCVPKVL